MRVSFFTLCVGRIVDVTRFGLAVHCFFDIFAERDELDVDP